MNGAFWDQLSTNLTTGIGSYGRLKASRDIIGRNLRTWLLNKPLSNDRTWSTAAKPPHDVSDAAFGKCSSTAP